VGLLLARQFSLTQRRNCSERGTCGYPHHSATLRPVVDGLQASAVYGETYVDDPSCRSVRCWWPV